VYILKRTLTDILSKVEIVKIIGEKNIPVTQIHFDSREVTAGSLFIAIKGLHSDGHKYINTAVKAGALSIVCEQIPDHCSGNITYIQVKNSSFALGIISSHYYDHPSSKLKLIGITGTNGKTTVATLLFNLFRGLKYNAGLLSTINNRINDQLIPSTHTTPDALQINRLLDQMVRNKCSVCFMEVSSHAIDQKRIEGLEFAGAIFTNITHEHLDYHKSFDSYISTKKSFFDHLPSSAFALTNTDDKNGRVMLQNTLAKKYTYSLRSMADFRCKVIENSLEGMELLIDGNNIWVQLAGTFNAYNLLAVYAAAILLGEDKEKILPSLSALKTADGRFEIIRGSNNISAIVDYAHTPDALYNVLVTLVSLKSSQAKVITVVGAGGERDTTKRPLMGIIACNYSDKVILTSDNPRSESPNAIIEEMVKEVDEAEQMKILKITDRKEAIKTACALANPGDIILIAGKGHESYQEVNGIRYPFNDKEIIKTVLSSNKLT